jgi:hypothetical protein
MLLSCRASVLWLSTPARRTCPVRTQVGENTCPSAVRQGSRELGVCSAAMTRPELRFPLCEDVPVRCQYPRFSGTHNIRPMDGPFTLPDVLREGEETDRGILRTKGDN